MPSAKAESVEIDGQGYMVCAQCRYPTERRKSWEVCYAVPQPGLPNPDPVRDKQALCTPCYLGQYTFIYPEAPTPVLPYGRLDSYGAVPRQTPKSTPPQSPDPRTDIEMWKAAIQRSMDSDGVETVAQAYAVLSETGIEVSGLVPE